MLTSKVKYTTELRTEAVHIRSGQIIITDAPIDNNGKGDAFSPTDLLATSLATCMLTIMGISGQEHGFSIDGTQAEITKVMASNPRRVSKVIIDLHFPENNYSEKHQRLIRAAVTTCPVSRSLHPDLEQDVRLHFA